MPISIVMPTYNGSKYVKQAIDSVTGQKYQDWELIVSDDESKDATRSYLETLRDPRIKVYFQPRNLGIFGNLNFLFTQASHEITQILCQDDYFVDSEALDKLVSLWSALPAGVGFVRCNHSTDANSRLSRFEKFVLPEIVEPTQSDLFFFIFGCIPGNLSNVSTRTCVVQRVGWFRTDLPYAGDFEFWSRLGHSSHWAISQMKVTQVRGHSEQASATFNRRGELMPQMRAVLESLHARLISHGYSRTLTRLMCTVNYVSQHRYIGVKHLILRKDGNYLRMVSKEFDAASCSFGPVLGWAVYFGSLGGRMFTVPLARMLLNQQIRA